MPLSRDELHELTRTVWSTTLGISLTPTEEGAPVGEPPPLAGVVQIEGAWGGLVILCCAPALAERAAAAVFPPPPQAPPRDVQDLLGELTNICGGHVKALLAEGAGPCRMSSPRVQPCADPLALVPGGRVVTEAHLAAPAGGGLRLLVIEEPQR